MEGSEHEAGSGQIHGDHNSGKASKERGLVQRCAPAGQPRAEYEGVPKPFVRELKAGTSQSENSKLTNEGLTANLLLALTGIFYRRFGIIICPSVQVLTLSHLSVFKF